MDRLGELRAKRLAAANRMREINDVAYAEAREFTAEEQQEYERNETDFDAVSSQITREERLQNFEAELGRSSAGNEGGFDPRLVQDGFGADEAAAFEQRDKAYTSAFGKYIRKREMTADEMRMLRQGWVEERDQVKGTPASGGYLVPISFQRAMYEFMVQAGTVRQLDTTRLVTASGEALQWPKTVAHGLANWVAETTPITATDESFGQVTFNSYKCTRLLKVSEELLEDNAVDLEGYLARELGRSIGARENNGFLQGTGTTMPTGIIPGITASGATTVTTAANNAVTGDELISLLFTVQPQYRRNGVWVFGDGALQAIRKLKDSQGRYLMDMAGGIGGLGGSTGGTGVDVLLGKPVYDDPDVPAFVAGNVFGIFGDFSAYGIRDVGAVGPPAGEKGVGGFAIRRLDERFADTLEVGFLGFHRTDGNLIDTTGALRYISLHT
jgi:HK97 family phage major capsid protein